MKILSDYYTQSPFGLQNLKARQYYEGMQDILSFAPTFKNIMGEQEEVFSENNTVIDNQVKRMVDQKSSYLASNTMTVQAEEDEEESGSIPNQDVDLILTTLQDYLQSDIREICREAILFREAFYDFDRRKTLPSENCIPLKGTKENPDLEGVISVEPNTFMEDNKFYLFFDITIYTTPNPKDKIQIIRPPESYYTPATVITQDGDTSPFNISNRTKFNQLVVGLAPQTAQKGTLLRFQSTASVYVRIKGLQDALNRLLSTLLNNIFEDKRSTIFVLKNYSGTNLDNFRHNLLTYGVIPVDTLEGVEGDVKTLKIDVNTDNLTLCIDLIKKAIIRNAGGYDVEDLKAGVTPNQMTIKAIFNEISLDSDNIESLFDIPFRKLVSLILNKPQSNDQPELKFNRSNVVIESQQIIDIMNLKGLLSTQSIIERIPGVSDPKEEYQKLQDEKEEDFKQEQEKLQQKINNTQTNQSQVYNQTQDLLH